MSSDRIHEKAPASVNTDGNAPGLDAASVGAWDTSKVSDAPAAEKASKPDDTSAKNSQPATDSSTWSPMNHLGNILKDRTSQTGLPTSTIFGLLAGMTLAEQHYGKGELVFTKKFAGVEMPVYANQLTAQKFLALPVAASAAYSFSRDFESLKHRKSLRETIRDSAALFADSVTIAGAAGAYIPKTKLIAAPLEVAGLAARAWLGELEK